MSAILPPGEFLNVLRSVLGTRPEARALHAPEFDQTESRWIKECLDSGWVSTAGPFVQKFEAAVASATDVPYAIATSNGTAALHLSLLLAGVERGHEVLVPTLTFVATANAVSYCGASPNFVDSEPLTLGIDPDKLERYLKLQFELRADGCFNRRTKKKVSALVAMHVFGHPSRLDEIDALCKAHRIALVEDAAEALGSLYNGKHVGNHGVLNVLSFNGNKVVTTGGGGAILTKNPKLAERAKHLSTTAKLPHPWAFDHDDVGFNYRLPNLNAALGCAQLEKLPKLLTEKRTLAENYKRAFESLPGFFFKEPPSCQSNHWLNTYLLPSPDLNVRNSLITACIEGGYGVRPAWTLMHRLPMYTASPKDDLSTAENLSARLINLPSSASLGRRFS